MWKIEHAGKVNVSASEALKDRCAAGKDRRQKVEKEKLADTLHDIVDTAAAAGSFTTLVAAVEAAGLVETLKGAGPFTVFAPTDDAFKALPAGTVETLIKPENKDQLVKILTLHVLSGKVMAADVTGKTMSPASVGGEALHVDGTDGVTVSGAKVVKADIACTNGVIHVIDKVILPKA